MSVATIDNTSVRDINGFADVGHPAMYGEDIWREPFEKLRREDPVHWYEDSLYGPYWALSRYKEIMDVELNDTAFSSAQELGGILIMDEGDLAKRKSFIRMDRPEHTLHRQTVAPMVGPTNLENMTALIRQRTSTVLDELPHGETFNLVDSVSIPLTTMMLATLFDFPFEECQRLTYWSNVATCDLNAPDPLVKTEEERTTVLQEMAARFRELYEERAKQEPKFDLLSMLAHSDVGRDMDDLTFQGTVTVLVIGGNDTTRNTMTGSVLALSQFPEQERLLREYPELVRNLIPETIRWQTPLPHMRRTAKTDAEIGGKKIAKGDKVVMWYISGNNDEEMFTDPYRFDITRKNVRRHLSFGAGIHRCVGDRLAELQLNILWEEILKRGMRFNVEGDPVRIYSTVVRGYHELPVSITT